MAREIVAGVIGAGVFGGYHAQKYARLPGVRLGGVYDVDEERARRVAAIHGAVPYANLSEFLEKIDVVTIASPASTHYELALQALDAGLHVLIEKPIALRLDHADRLNELSKERSLIVQVGHQERFIFEGFGILARKDRPRSIWCRRCNPPTGRGEDASVVFDLMIHDLDLVRVLELGDVASISASGDLNEVDAEIAFAGGAAASFQSSRRAGGRDRRMALVYDDGTIEIDFVKRTITNTTPSPLATSFDAAVVNPAFADPLGHGVMQFIAAVRGERGPAVTADEGRAALEWAIAIDVAAKAAGASRVRVRVRA